MNKEVPFSTEDFPEEALPTDYKDAYEQHIKDEEKAKKEDAEELIRDYKSGFDFEKEEMSVNKPEPTQEAPKTSETSSKEKSEVKKEAPEAAPEKPAEAPKKIEQAEPVDSEKSKAEKIPEKLTDEQYKAIKEAKKDLDAVKNYQKRHTGLLQKLGFKRNEDAEVEKDLKDRQKAYDDVILRVMKENGMMEGAVEAAFAERSTKEFLTLEMEKILRQKEQIEPEKKALFDKVKKVFGNKYVQLVVGTAILGVAIAAPPVGFLTSLGLPGIVPASFGPAAKALWAGLGGVGVGAGLINLRNALRKDNIDTISSSDLRRGGRNSRNSEDLKDEL